MRTILEGEIEPPRDVARAIARAPASSRAALRAQLAGALADALDELVRPVECRAVERYVLAARLARRGALATDDAEQARARLVAYGEERVADCLRGAAEREPTFDAYRPGELDRAGRGLQSPWPRTRPRPRSNAERAVSALPLDAGTAHASTAARDDAQISLPAELRSDPQRMKLGRP